jgi:hypothetical protein
MKLAKVCVNSPGPKSPAIAVMLAIAPCSRPCSEGETRRVINACADGPANPHSAITGTPTRKIVPVGASP